MSIHSFTCIYMYLNYKLVSPNLFVRARPAGGRGRGPQGRSGESGEGRGSRFHDAAGPEELSRGSGSSAERDGHLEADGRGAPGC